jgi:hypothetical protein
MRPEMTGYDTEDRYYASRYKQGGRTTYTLELPLAVITQTVPKPDPNKLTEGNRKINDAHARSFGAYVRDHKDWVAPALILRATDVFEFEAIEDIGKVQFGVLKIPKIARTELKILDGQHRILGLHYAMETLIDEMSKARDRLAEARRQENKQLLPDYEARIKQLEDQRARLHNELIGVHVYLEDDPERYKQMFVDIAENALGISTTIKTRFDHRKVVNRALDAVLSHALLDGRVDMQQDRVKGSSLMLMGAKHVADIIRTVAVGISGRVSRKQEATLVEAELAERANNFFTVMIDSFPELNEVIEGKLKPAELRKQSLLGSATMLRVMAGVYHELSTEKSEDEIGDFFTKLVPHMGAPLTDASVWVKVPGGIFSPGTTAPKARSQDLRHLTDTIVSWATSEPEWLAA